MTMSVRLLFTANRRSGLGARGQALLELAVFGMVTLAALGFLIRLGMQMNHEQEVRMGAFRRALAAARADDGTSQDAMAVAYHLVLDRQMPNPSDGFMTLSRGQTQASAFVEVGDRLTFAYEDPNNPNSLAGRKTQPRFIVRVNEREESYRQNDFPADGDLFPGSVANRAFIRESVSTTTTPNSTIEQTATASRISSSTQTHSCVVVNTKAAAGEQVCSDIASGTNVTWSH